MKRSVSSRKRRYAREGIVMPGQLCSAQRLGRVAILPGPVSGADVLAGPGAGGIRRPARFAAAMGVLTDRGPITVG